VAKRTGQKLLGFDRKLGARLVVGADEAGRGSLAGPLVVAGVLLDYDCLRDHRVRPLALLNDSKQVDEATRDELYLAVLACAERVSVHVFPPGVIDRDRSYPGVDVQPGDAQSGRPIGGALIEVWQANAAGRYRHEVAHMGFIRSMHDRYLRVTRLRHVVTARQNRSDLRNRDQDHRQLDLRTGRLLCRAGHRRRHPSRRGPVDPVVACRRRTDSGSAEMTALLPVPALTAPAKLKKVEEETVPSWLWALGAGQ